MKKNGFTILELLIVLAIVGMLAAAAIFMLNVSRSKTRDAKRISDISVLRSGLSQYWLQMASYPVSNGSNLGQSAQNTNFLTTEGFVGAEGGGNVILQAVPIGPKSNEFYFYKADVGGYSIRFVLERKSAYGLPGTYYAHAVGVDQEDSLK
ncbi:MAG: type II secretion system protein [Patescibacteria group bacterium]|nr:type II secretion system GspH family protein [Patescibacteria group bacterium]